MSDQHGMAPARRRLIPGMAPVPPPPAAHSRTPAAHSATRPDSDGELAGCRTESATDGEAPPAGIRAVLRTPRRTCPGRTKGG